MTEFIKRDNNDRLILFIHGLFGDRKTWMTDKTQPRNFITYLMDNVVVQNHFDIAIFQYYTRLSDIGQRANWFWWVIAWVAWSANIIF